MSLVDRKSDLSQINKPFDNSKQHEAPRDPNDSNFDIDGKTQNIRRGKPLVEMTSKFAPIGNTNYAPAGTSPHPSLHGPPDPAENSQLNLDGQPTLGLETLLNIPNPSLYSLPPDAPTTLIVDNPHPISTGLVDYFSGRKGEWGNGTYPLGFTSNMQDSLLHPLIDNEILLPLTWNIGASVSEHPFGSNDGYSLNIEPSYVSNLQLGSSTEPMLYPIGIENVDPLIPTETTLHTITNPPTYTPNLTFTFTDTPVVQDGTYTSSPYGLEVTPQGNYGSSLGLTGGIQTMIPSTLTSPNTQFGISYGEYNFDSISDMAVRYRGIHIAGNEPNLYPYADIYAGVEDTESSLLNITNPSTYTDNLTFTFSDTPAIADGTYTPTPYDLVVNPEGNYGSSLLLTGGIQTMIPKTVLSTTTQFGLAYGPYDFDSIGGLSLRYKGVHTPGNETNLYPYTDLDVGVGVMDTGLHLINNPNNNEFYTQTQIGYDWANPPYGGDNTSGEPPFVDTLGKLKSRFGTDGTGRYTINSQTTTQRYTFPALNQPTEYKFDTQFGYTYTDAYDKIYGNIVKFRVKDEDPSTSPLQGYIGDGLWSTTSETVNNYGYHSRMAVPKDYQGDSSTYHTFDSISALATRYKGLHTAYAPTNLYPYTSVSSSGMGNTTLNSINSVTITPSYTYPTIPVAEGGQNMSIGPFTTDFNNLGRHTGENNTWPISNTIGDGGEYNGPLVTNFASFYNTPDEGDIYKSNYGFNSRLEIKALNQEKNIDNSLVTTQKPHPENYSFNKISDLAIRYKGISTSDLSIPGRSGGDFKVGKSKSSFTHKMINSRYKKVGNINLKEYAYDENNPANQMWFSGPFGFTGRGDSGIYKIPTGDGFNNLYQFLNKASLGGTTAIPPVGPMAASVIGHIGSVSRFLLSPRGLIWIGAQFGLNLLNQRPETRIFNPLSTLGSLIPMMHIDRHMGGFAGGSFPFIYGARYENAPEVNVEQTIEDITANKGEYKSRLLQLRYDRFLKSDEDKGLVKALSGLKKFVEFNMEGLRGGNVIGGSPQSTAPVVNSMAANNTLTDVADTQEYRLHSFAEIQQLALAKKSNFEKRQKSGAQKTQESSFKMGKQGLPDMKRVAYDDDGNSTILFSSKLGNGTVKTYDEINSVEPFQVEGDNTAEKYDSNDFVRFRLVFDSKLNPTTGELWGNEEVKKTVLVFRAIIDGLTDNFSGDYGENNFVGRPDKVYTYKGFNREISFNLSIHPTSRVELEPLYNKLNTLVGLTSPDMDSFGGNSTIGHRMVAPIVKMTLGNYFENVPVVLKSVNLTVDDKGTWEIDKGMQLPRYIKAAISINYIGDSVPRLGKRYFDYKGFDKIDKHWKSKILDKHTDDTKKI